MQIKVRILRHNSDCETGLMILTGCKLLDISLHESYSVERDRGTGIRLFSRQLYIHALTYLLRGLPIDLSPEETISIQSSIPEVIREDIAQRARAQELVRIQQGQLRGREGTKAQRSILHRAVAYTVLQFFLLFNLMLPYIRIFVGCLYRCERKHRLSERIFSAGINGLDIMGKRGVELSQTVYGLNDGKVGQSINEILVWWISGVTGGIHEGVGEGLSIVSKRHPNASMKRVTESSNTSAG